MNKTILATRAATSTPLNFRVETRWVEAHDQYQCRVYESRNGVWFFVREGWGFTRKEAEADAH